ncbi:tubulin-like doman-containing protein [Streptomyces thermocarboxydus]
MFVAFSVAGGTGTGIFLDYLHLIGQAFKDKRFRGARIYPLVVMPSAFPEAKGGGREAELNAARAVVDLSRLVDEQNAPHAEAELGDVDLRSRCASAIRRPTRCRCGRARCPPPSCSARRPVSAPMICAAPSCPWWCP